MLKDQVEDLKIQTSQVLIKSKIWRSEIQPESAILVESWGLPTRVQIIEPVSWVPLRPIKLGPVVTLVEIWVHVVYRYCNLYRIPPDPWGLATYIKGPGEDGEGQIESKRSLLLRLLSIHTLFDWFYLRVHPTPYSPDPRSFILDICRVNPRHLPSPKSLDCLYMFGASQL
jgi:hypothetical protein